MAGHSRERLPVRFWLILGTAGGTARASDAPLLCARSTELSSGDLLTVAGSALASTPYICNTDNDSMVRHYLVKGRVQGVGFRWFVHHEAGALGLHGWVRNTEEGDVEVVAKGEADELHALRAALARGSRGSRVDAVIEQELDESEGPALGSFQIEGAW